MMTSTLSQSDLWQTSTTSTRGSGEMARAIYRELGVWAWTLLLRMGVSLWKRFSECNKSTYLDLFHPIPKCLEHYKKMQDVLKMKPLTNLFQRTFRCCQASDQVINDLLVEVIARAPRMRNASWV